MNGSKKLFQVHQKLKVTTVAIAGLLSGTMMLQRICKTFAPSIRAASSSSRGIVEKNWRSMKIRKAFPKNERTNSGHSVFTAWTSRKNSYSGKMVTGKGSIMV